MGIPTHVGLDALAQSAKRNGGGVLERRRQASTEDFFAKSFDDCCRRNDFRVFISVEGKARVDGLATVGEAEHSGGFGPHRFELAPEKS